MLNLKSFFKNLRMNEEKISLALGATVVVIVGILLYNYFTAVNKRAELTQEAAQEAATAKNPHVVKPGEHLWQISVQYYNDGYQWAEIAKANNLSNPNKIEVGQVLVLPEIEVQPQIAGDISINEQINYPSEYTVKTGDSLWKISVEVYADGYQWTKIWQANKTKVANPNIIETGVVLSIPR